MLYLRRDSGPEPNGARSRGTGHAGPYLTQTPVWYILPIDARPAEPVARLAEFEAECRRRGLAVTIQRRTVFGELAGRKDHPTADQVYDAVRGRLPGLSRTTVYRVLETLVDAGLARKVHHAGGVARFDPMTGPPPPPRLRRAAGASWTSTTRWCRRCACPSRRGRASASRTTP